MRYTLAIFDLDGTVLDTLDDLTAAVNHALVAGGFPARTRDEVRGFVGNGIQKLIERALPADTDAASADRVHAAFSAYYGEHCADQTAPYNGIFELLHELRQAGVRTALVSNKADFAVRLLCERYFPDSFDVFAGERAGIRRKPAPDMVDAVLRELAVPGGSAVYIGDSDVDIETARNCGIPCLSVAWGFRDAGFLKAHGASKVLETPAELATELLNED